MDSTSVRSRELGARHLTCLNSFDVDVADDNLLEPDGVTHPPLAPWSLILTVRCSSGTS
jgi:hypothetical protein